MNLFNKKNIVDNKKNIVEKSNELNTVRNYNPIQEMTLTEYRFFCLYLSKLNARNSNLRTIVISLKEFEELFEVSLHTTHFNDTIEKIMNRKLKIHNKNGKMSIINLYSKFEWLDNNNCKEIEVTCNYDIVPYLFELKNNYTSYRIVNIVNLNSVAKIRLYEVCKQYQKLCNIQFEIKDLQEMLCCNITEFRDFNQKILKPAIRDINEYTDIIISYEKVLSCRKVVALTFTINKKVNINEEFPLQIEKPQEKPVEREKSELSSTFENSYLPEQLESLLDIAKSVSSNPEAYLKSIYYQIKARNRKINNLYSYTLSIINADLKGIKEVQPSKTPKETSILFDDKPSYDLDAYERALFQSIQKFCDIPKTREEVAEESHNRPTEPLILDFKDCENYNDVCQYTSDLGEEIANKYNCDAPISFAKDFKAYCNAMYEVYNVEISIKNIQKLEKSLIYASDDETSALKSVLRYFYEQ